MSKNPESSEIGEIFQEWYECETITWKIPNVSMLEITDDTELRSPWFSYKKAAWILKMRPCVKQDVEVHIERLHSEIPVHKFLYAMFFKDHHFFSDRNTYKSLKYNLNSKQSKMHINAFRRNWYSLFYHKSAYRCNDTITLIVKILIKKNAAFELGSETTLGSKFTKNEDSLQSTGELFVESFQVDVVAWKIPKIHSIPVEVDNRVQSPMFSFAGASWILKLFLYGQASFKSECYVDVVIERLQSHIQKHPVLYQFFVHSNFENVSLIRDWLSHVKGFFIFDADHTQENVLRYKSYDDFLEFAESKQQFGTIYLISEFRSPKKSEILLNFQGGSVQPIIKLLEVPRNSEKLEVGEIIKKPFECEVISWRIPNFSSLLSSEDNAVQSQLFSYKGAIWNFKMFPYVHKFSKETGFIKIAIKRLLSQIPVHNVFFRFLRTDYVGNKIDGEGKYFIFDSYREQREVILDWPDTFDLYKDSRHNDTLTLSVPIL